MTANIKGKNNQLERQSCCITWSLHWSPGLELWSPWAAPVQTPSVLPWGRAHCEHGSSLPCTCTTHHAAWPKGTAAPLEHNVCPDVCMLQSVYASERVCCYCQRASGRQCIQCACKQSSRYRAAHKKVTISSQDKYSCRQEEVEEEKKKKRERRREKSTGCATGCPCRQMEGL